MIFSQATFDSIRAALAPVRIAVLLTALISAAFMASAEAATPAVTVLPWNLDEACRSNAPVLVVDSFAPTPDDPPTLGILAPSVDIDGDDVPDIFHGDLVEKLIQLGGNSTVRKNLSESSSLPDLYDLLLPIVTAIEKGDAHYSRINLSQETPLLLSSFKKDIFPEDQSFPEIDAINIKEHAARILEKLWNDRPDLKIEELTDLFRRLEAKGVPVIVAAGNFGPRFVNLFSMLPGTYSVGSLEVNGDKLRTSSDNAFAAIWRPGVVVPTAVKGGMDLNGDEQPEFFGNNISGGPAIVDKWNGRFVSGALSRVTPEFSEWAARAAQMNYVVPNAAVNVIDAGLYMTNELIALPTVTEGTKRLFQSLGTYALKRDGSPPRYFFSEKHDGTLLFDPKRDGSPNQRTRIGGTSFAAPRICKN